ncbi:uncharacterized protein LOC143624111 [Bidens hawaiensis]|uniref:uncharacterized protein LOC143624111 n=1 Tax=Bidens hawaiensis TaxID=980011 RepID=UPI004049E183
MANDKEAGSLRTMKESIGGFVLQAPKLTSTKYASWSVMLKIILGANEIDKEKGTDIEERKKFMALGIIFQTLPKDVMLQMAKYSLSWCRKNSESSCLNAKNRVRCIEDGETESIDDYAAKLGGVKSKYKSLRAVLEEEVLVRKFLNSMSDKYLPVVSSMELLADIETMAFEDVVGRLKAYEERNKGRGRYNGGGRGNPRWNSERKNDEWAEYQKRNHEEWEDRRKYVTCYNCDNIGHYSNECKEPSKGNDEVNLTKKEDDVDPSLFMAVGSIKKVSLNEERVIPGVFEKDEKNEGTWYLDNGASHHMLGKKEFFTTLDEGISGQVKFGDGSEIEIKGKGNVTVVGKTGEKKTFCDVFYIPKLKTNLLSLGKLDEEGCKIEIANGILRLYDQKKRLLMKVQRNLNKTYNIKLQVCCNSNFEVEKKESYDVKPIMKVKEIRFGMIPNDLFGVR